MVGMEDARRRGDIVFAVGTVNGCVDTRRGGCVRAGEKLEESCIWCAYLGDGPFDPAYHIVDIRMADTWPVMKGRLLCVAWHLVF